MKRLIVLLSALLLAVMPVQAKAQEQSDVTAKCYTEAGSVEGLEVSLYKVGDVSGGKLTFTEVLTRNLQILHNGISSRMRKACPWMSRKMTL